MCESCDDIDKRIEQLLPLTLHPSERDHVNQLIEGLQKERAGLHQDPQ
jgi:hypothetical protein